jgi:hypothetical protein
MCILLSEKLRVFSNLCGEMFCLKPTAVSIITSYLLPMLLDNAPKKSPDTESSERDCMELRQLDCLTRVASQ